MTRPSEQRGGTNASQEEGRAKGEWVESAADGVVPADLGGSDAPPTGADPDYGSAALGRTTGDDSPATAEGIDLSAGDDADATSIGNADPTPDGEEPDQRDATKP